MSHLLFDQLDNFQILKYFLKILLNPLLIFIKRALLLIIHGFKSFSFSSQEQVQGCILQLNYKTQENKEFLKITGNENLFSELFAEHSQIKNLCRENRDH